MIIIKEKESHTIFIGTEALKQVPYFIYQSAIISEDSKPDYDLKARTSAKSKFYLALNRNCINKREERIKMHFTYILTYACGSWASGKSCIQATEMKNHSRVVGKPRR